MYVNLSDMKETHREPQYPGAQVGSAVTYAPLQDTAHSHLHFAWHDVRASWEKYGTGHSNMTFTTPTGVARGWVEVRTSEGGTKSRRETSLCLTRIQAIALRDWLVAQNLDAKAD